MKSLLAALPALFLPAVAGALEVPDFSTANLVLGQSGFSTDTLAGSPTAATLDEPSGVVVDPATGKVFVADTGNHRVLRYASAAALQNGASAEMVFGQDSLTSKNATTVAPDTLFGPTGLCIDSGGRLWISDFDANRVLMFRDAATIPFTGNSPSADLVLGQPNGTTGTAGTTSSKLNGPNGITVDTGGRLWVSDTGNNRILRFDDAANNTTGAANGVQGQGQDPSLKFTSSTAKHNQDGFDSPTSVAMDATGTLWVTDSGNNRVLGFPSAATVSDGTNAARIIGQPDFNPSSITPGTAANRLSGPSGVFADSRGGLWVLDQGNNRALYYRSVQSLNINDPASLVVGQASFTSSSSGLSAQQFDSPFLGIFAEPVGDLWISDLNHHRVLRFGAVDKVAPSIAIRGRARITTPKKRVVIRGVASDDVAVTRVTLQIGRKKIVAAGTSSWKKTIPLKTRRTVVKAFATDAAGNVSPTARVVIVQKPKKSKK